MLAIDLIHVVLLMSMSRSLYSASINSTTFTSRKIIGGTYVSHKIRYIVYLIQAEHAKTQYDSWICGGAIVSKDFIVTSAACVEDIQYMYAISGYHRYVNGEEVNKDECARASKKKIVYICVPQRYEFAYDKIQKWAKIDLAAVKVESPYDFAAPTLRGCSWTPNKIAINYDAIYQVKNRDALVLGWGHSSKWRSKDDPKDYNQNLKYVSMKILNKIDCKKKYSKIPELLPIIDKYMICTMYEGDLMEDGQFINRVPFQSKVDGCSRKHGSKCQEEYSMNEEINDDETEYVIPYKKPEAITRTLSQKQKENDQLDIPVEVTTNADDRATKQTNENENEELENTYDHTTEQTITDDNIAFEDILNLRRLADIELLPRTTVGICQNDHGGPLVSWVGGKERLIGVASVFRLNKKFSCIGPFLFTSTQCNGAFLNCIIGDELDGTTESARKHFKNMSLEDIKEENVDNPKTNPEDALKNKDHPDLNPDIGQGNNDNITNSPADNEVNYG